MKHQYLVDKNNQIRVTIVFDKLGRQQSITNGVATSVFAYDPATLALDTETITCNLPGQPAFTPVIDRSRDNLGRDTGWELKNGNTIENEVVYGYSATEGRLATVSNSNSAFRYDYLAGANLVEKVTATAGAVHTVTNTYEPTRNVLDIKENKAGTTIISKYDYLVNAIGQRTEVNTSGTAFPATPSWSWGYDSLGQVISANSSVNTNDRAYQYDAIGNRKKSANSLTPPSSDNYTSNALNQYSSIGNPQSTIVNPLHDFDGNATSYPLPADPGNLSTLAWDAENRLVSATIGTTTTTYFYDAQSRRIAKTTGGATTLFIYDGWNCIAEWSADLQSASLAKTRLWGLDLSGTMQGAGGVGGMLAERHHSGTAANHYPTYDGNGNVSEFVATAGSVTAHFEYDPFGNTVVNTDTGNLFAYRFSTKPLDSETGLYYYGYRYYDPVTGRWPSRDPIGEWGGLNLYGFTVNNGVGAIDYLGNLPLGYLRKGQIIHVACAKITVTDYDAGEGGNNVDGVPGLGLWGRLYLDAEFEKSNEVEPCCCTNLRWVQTVKEDNGPTAEEKGNTAPYPDGPFPDGMTFRDTPFEGVVAYDKTLKKFVANSMRSSLNPSGQDNLRITFSLKVLCIRKDKEAKEITTLNWGFEANSKGADPNKWDYKTL